MTPCNLFYQIQPKTTTDHLHRSWDKICDILEISIQTTIAKPAHFLTPCMSFNVQFKHATTIIWTSKSRSLIFWNAIKSGAGFVTLYKSLLKSQQHLQFRCLIIWRPYAWPYMTEFWKLMKCLWAHLGERSSLLENITNTATKWRLWYICSIYELFPTWKVIHNWKAASLHRLIHYSLQYPL